MNEIENFMDYILINGYLDTFSDKKSFPYEIYSDIKLTELVLEPLENYLLEGFDETVISVLESNEDHLPACLNLINRIDRYYTCLDCCANKNCIMCHECFFNSSHAYHEYEYLELDSKYARCDCGDVEAWRCDPTCSKHQVSANQNPSLSEEFILKFGSILKHIFTLLEKVVSNDDKILESEYEKMLVNHNKILANFNLKQKYQNLVPTYHNLVENEMGIKSINREESCLLVFFGESRKRCQLINGFETCLQMGKGKTQLLVDKMISDGYVCIKYKTNLEDCLQTKEKIEKCPRLRFANFPFDCKIVSVPVLYFMRLSCALTKFIFTFCKRKTQLCNLLAHLLFENTVFLKLYLKNEPFLCEQIRQNIINNVFTFVLNSEYGKGVLIELFLSNLDEICSNFMIDDHENVYSLINLTRKFIARPKGGVRLIENGFLTKMFDFLTRKFENLCIIKGERNQKLSRQRNSANIGNRLLYLLKLMRESLISSFPIENWSIKFRSEIISAGLRGIDFCFVFDDLETLKNNSNRLDQPNPYNGTYLLAEIHRFMIALFKWLYICPDALTKMLERCLLLAHQEFQSVFEGCNNLQAVKNMIGYSDMENREILMFNLSHRFFIEMLIWSFRHSNSETKKIFVKVVNDHILLMWITLSSVASIASTIEQFRDNWRNNSWGFYGFFGHDGLPEDFHHIYLLDLTAIQILFAYLPPDQVLKYLIFNMFPGMIEKAEFSHPLSFIFRLPQFDNYDPLLQLLALIYNVISERHFIGEVQNCEEYLTERQLIHYLALEDRPLKDTIRNIYCCPDGSTLEHNEFLKYVKGVAVRVSDLKTSPNKEIYSLKPGYFKKVNPFYFMYSSTQSFTVLKNLVSLKKRSIYNFEIAKIAKARPEFGGIADFLFSSEMFDLIMHSFKKLVDKDFGSYNIERADHLLLSVIFLCFMLKLSENEKITSVYQQRINQIYVPRNELNGQSIIELLSEFQAESNLPVLHSVIEYLFKLSYEPNKMHQDDYNHIFVQKNQVYSKDLKISKNSPDAKNAKTQKLRGKADFKNNRQKQNLNDSFYCEVCRNLETVQTSSDFDIFQYSTSYLSYALARWAPKLDHITPSDIEYIEDCEYEFENLFDAVYSGTGPNKRLPNLIISGCCHNVHTKCLVSAEYQFNVKYRHLVSKPQYNCIFCRNTYNFLLPSNHPIPNIHTDDVPFVHVGTLIKQLRLIYESNIFKGLKTEQKDWSEKEKRLDELAMKELNATGDILNPYWKICSVFFYMYENESNNVNAKDFCEYILDIVLSALTSTINDIEKYHRDLLGRPTIFDPSFVQGSNFNISTQFSRFCYYAGGLAPAFKISGVETEEISHYLTSLYLRSIQKFIDFIKLFDRQDVQDEDLKIILNIDHFSEFSSILIRLSTIMHLDPSTKHIFAKNWETSLAYMFYLLVIFNVFIYYSKIKPQHVETGVEYDIKNVEQIWQLYASIFLVGASTVENQQALYELFLFNALPFLRKASILLYQLFNWKPELSNCKEVLDHCGELKSLLKYLNIPENPLTAWNAYDSTFISVLEKFGSMPPKKLPFVITREKYLKETSNLVPLPLQYVKLYLASQYIECKMCQWPVKTSLKCLICGVIIPQVFHCDCSKEKLLTDVVLNHVIICDGTYGLFLQLNPTAVIYYQPLRLVFLDLVLYQDRYGDRPGGHASALSLSEERYRILNENYKKDWLQSYLQQPITIPYFS